MAGAPESHRTRKTVFDDIAYWVTLVSVYFLVGVLFFYSGKGKLFDGHGKPPPAIEQQFEGTFVATFPGVNVLWWILSILEFSIFVILCVSLLTGEFLPRRRKRILLVGLSLALSRSRACRSARPQPATTRARRRSTATSARPRSCSCSCCCSHPTARVPG
jgi:hypothetical protein